LQVYREFPIKACREVRFSHGGHLFAIANGTLVQVYNTHTCEPIGTARGHSGKVAALSWSHDDVCVVSAGRDGAIYEWQVAGMKRGKEHVLKGCQYVAVAATPDGNAMLAAGSDKMLKALEDQGAAGTQIKAEIDAGEGLACLELAMVSAHLQV
jgi:cilia- and flagella-associated protein 57